LLTFLSLLWGFAISYFGGFFEASVFGFISFLLIYVFFNHKRAISPLFFVFVILFIGLFGDILAILIKEFDLNINYCYWAMFIFCTIISILYKNRAAFIILTLQMFLTIINSLNQEKSAIAFIYLWVGATCASIFRLSFCNKLNKILRF